MSASEVAARAAAVRAGSTPRARDSAVGSHAPSNGMRMTMDSNMSPFRWAGAAG